MVSQLTDVEIIEDHEEEQQNYSINNLTIGNKDQKLNFQKYSSPIILPNQNINQPYHNTLNNLRSTFKYVFVINWLYKFRGFLKLQSEVFDVDLFELELLNYFPELDSKILFINKLKIAIMKYLDSNKLPIEQFEIVFRLHFGVFTPLSGNSKTINKNDENINHQDIEEIEEIIQDHDHNDHNSNDLPKFDYLLIEDKFEILFIALNYISNNHKFRNWISNQSNNSPEFSRIDPIFSTTTKKNIKEEYVLLFDNQRLYKRTIEFPALEVPKKLKDSPTYPNEFFKSKQFDISSTIKFEIIYLNLFEFNDYLNKIKYDKNLKSIYQKLYKPSIIESFYENEIKKRKIFTSKKKEIQLANLLAVRKRSLRLREKEKTTT
ncbi:hypothetical protein KGF54_003928 [Candida jiufengensis]|uniref:uncharacterized protein n=1 Tax=Candida jiufengensis TaxID=497108 RepID=UPI0022246C2B|nr:uncharacterized protein KGF54_003928 [Candida jiufengensis]KAI5950854.1 hypothetical protein KGF54_003928 [Candida jiufengensis]